ncbi:MAG: beta-galactosidase [Lentisphaeria bacterium]|nr:beta-galactosidase [Lentisphaeria bacterium]
MKKIALTILFAFVATLCAEQYAVTSPEQAITCPYANLDWLGTFNVSFKTKGAAGKATISFLDVHGRPCGLVVMPIDASADWELHEKLVETPDRAASAEFAFRTNGKGTLLIDDVKAVRLSRKANADAMQLKPLDDAQWNLNEESIGIITDEKQWDYDPNFTPKMSGITELPTCSVVQENGLSCIQINGKTVNPTHTWFSGHSEVNRHEQQCAYEAGLRIVAIDVREAGFYETGFDYRHFDEFIEMEIEDNPDAYFLIYTDFDGRYHRWWSDAHPEALCRPEDGAETMGAYAGRQEKLPSMGSRVWRDTYASILRNLIRHIKESPYASRIMGFHVASGISWEWLHWGGQNNQLCDYSECGQQDFRRFLKLKYSTDEALQKAWNQKDVTLDTAKVPSEKQRRNPADGHYYDVNTERNVLDYHEYQHFVISDCITELAGVIKEETDRKSLVGAFFGYTCFMYEAGLFGQSSGHYNVRKVLDSPDVDYLIAPVAYSGRQPGSTTGTMSTFWSCNANGKIFFNHADFRTQWASGDDYCVDSLKKSIQILHRELARNLAQGNAIQIMDFTRGWTLGDKRLCDIVTDMLDVMGKYRGKTKDFPKKDYLLVVIDEEFQGHFALENPPLDREWVYYQLMNLDMSGVPHRVVLFSDLMKHPELQQYGGYLFLSPYLLDDEKTAFLQNKIIDAGKFAAFVGAPGLCSPEGLTSKTAERLFGIPCRFVKDDVELRCNATQLWPELNGLSWGCIQPKEHGFLLLPENATQEQIVGTLADGTPAALYLTGNGRKVFWSAAPGLKPPLLRALAKRAGIPVISEQNDGIYTGCGFVGIHAHADGEKTIHLPESGSVTEILSGKTWPQGTTDITIPMKLGDTAIFHVEF